MGFIRTYGRGAGWPVRAAAMLLAVGALAGCSDAWDTVSRPLDPLPPADPQEIEAPQQGAGEYPSLSSVPDAPPRRPSRREERQEIRESLSSDRANARYSDEQRTGEGIEARRTDAGADEMSSPSGTGPGSDGSQSGSASSAGTAAANAQPSSDERAAGDRMTEAPERPDVAERMPADDAGAASQRAAGQPRGSTSQPDGQARDDQPAAPDVPQLQQSEQGEPIEVPAQPSFDRESRSGGASAGQTSRAQQQQSASRETRSAVTTPGPEVGQSRTLSRQDAGGQTMADGGRRVAVIYFRHGSSSLQGQDRQVLREIARIYQRQGRDLRVVGHASSRTVSMDPVAHRMANFDTSLKRAQAVVDALVAMGVPREDIQLEARGDNEPVYHEFMPTGEAGNRRAEIFLEG